jgi:hypothetical protein
MISKSWAASAAGLLLVTLVMSAKFVDAVTSGREL